MSPWTEADERAWWGTVEPPPPPPRRWWSPAADLLRRIPPARQSLVVALLSALSALVYVLAAESLRNERAALPYRRWLFGELRAGRVAAVAADAPGIAMPADAGGAWTVVAFAGACLLAALLGWMARRDERDVGPELALYAFAAAIAPALVLAGALWPDGRGRLTSPALITAVLGVVAVAGAAALRAGVLRGRSRARGGGGGVAWPASSGADIWAAASLVAAALVLPFLWWNATSAIRGYDSLAYHLPLAATWLRRSRIATGAEEQLTSFFPGNHELLVRWALALGTDRYAFAVSLAAALLCVYAVYKIGRELGQPWAAAVAAGACAATSPLLVYLGTTSYSDVTAAAPLLLAVLFLLRWARTGCERTPLLACAGAAIGLAAGAKLSALPPAFAIALAALALGVRAATYRVPEGAPRAPALGPPTQLRLPPAWRQLAAFAAPAALCGGYWYARNLVEHGNPFFPVSFVGMRGVSMRSFIYARPELVAPSWRWPLYPWREFGFRSEYEDALGIAFAALCVPGLLLTPLARRHERRLRHVVWLIAAGSFVLWLQTGNATPRYGLFAILLSYVFVGELWTRFGSLPLRALTLACVAGATLVTGHSLAAHAAYTEVTGGAPRRDGVPAAVDTLPPARIYNAAGAQRTYFAMGRDHRHEVITPFGDATPDELRRVRPHYALLDDRQLAAFAPRIGLTLVARSSDPASTLGLWRVEPLPPPPPPASAAAAAADGVNRANR